MDAVSADVLGTGLDPADTGVDNLELLEVNEAIRYTEVEAVGAELRAYMGAMQPII
jgi:ketol-acid reductoisomerase